MYEIVDVPKVEVIAPDWHKIPFASLQVGQGIVIPAHENNRSTRANVYTYARRLAGIKVRIRTQEDRSLLVERI